MTSLGSMSIPLFLERVRDQKPLQKEDIENFISNLATIPIEQTSAFLAHVFHRPLNAENTAHLTFAMKNSGKSLVWKTSTKPIVDKHSTGGVGDKISICLAPLLASLDFNVPMVSGRSLGFTGGTLDKLESIPGMSTALSLEKICTQVNELGLAFGAQTHDFAPADKILYSLRDITATVDSMCLITASILSKKLSESLDGIVFDVK